MVDAVISGHTHYIYNVTVAGVPVYSIGRQWQSVWAH